MRISNENHCKRQEQLMPGRMWMLSVGVQCPLATSKYVKNILIYENIEVEHSLLLTPFTTCSPGVCVCVCKWS